MLAASGANLGKMLSTTQLTHVNVDGLFLLHFETNDRTNPPDFLDGAQGLSVGGCWTAPSLLLLVRLVKGAFSHFPLLFLSFFLLASQLFLP